VNPDQILGFIIGVIFVAGWLILSRWLKDCTPPE